MNRAIAAAVGVLTAGSVMLLMPSTAAAAGAKASSAGSGYSRSDCQLMLSPGNGRPSLYCTRQYTEQSAVDAVAVVADGTCPNGYRLVSVTGTLQTVWRVWDLYDGPAPLDKFNVAGNEAPVSETMLNRVENDLGCG